MTTLTEFLNDCLDRDEAYARNAFRPHGDEGPKNGPEWREIWSGTVECGPGGEHIATFDSQLSRHIERHDPARVLREVAAKRSIIEEHSGTHSCGADHATDDDPCNTLKFMAAIHEGHPGYRKEWAA